MKKALKSFFIFIIFFIYIFNNYQAYSLEKLKYIGEISLEKKFRPIDIVVLENGDFFIADAKTHSLYLYNRFGNLIKKITINKKRIFSRGGAIAVDKDNNILIADTASNKITKLSSDFNELFTIGSTGYSESQFRYPTGICADKDNNFYVADSGNRRIQIFNQDGIFFGQIISGEKISPSKSSYKKQNKGSFKGAPEITLPYLGKPIKVDVDDNGNIYVLDSQYATIHIYNSHGDPMFSINIKTSLRIRGNIHVIDLSVSNDKIYVLTRENIKVFNAKNGTYITNIGSKGRGRGQFYKPSAIYTFDNIIYVLDSGNYRIQIMEFGKKRFKSKKIQKTLKEKVKIAIFDFKNTNALSKQKQFGETVSEMFITSCVNTANFLVVERKEIKRVLNELQFDMSTMVDIKTAKQVGKILGVDYGIVGSVAVFEDAIEIDIRFIDLETGVIILAESKRATDEANLREAVNDIVAKLERIYVNRIGAPQPPGGFFTLGGVKSVYIRWDKNPEEDVVSYKIYRADKKDGEFKLIATIKTNEFNDKGLKDASTYYYRISAIDSKGNESKPSEIIICKTKEKPTFGYILKIRTRNYVKKCKFSWNKPSDEKIKEYRIYRADSENGEYKFVGTTKKTSFEDKGLEDGKTYYYRIKKIFPDGRESQFSNAFQCSTEARPQKPINLKAQSNLARKIIIKWDHAKIDNDIKYYEIYRSEFPDENFKMIKKTRSKKFTDKNLLDNKTYYYKIKAIDKYGLSSEFSDTISATTKNIPSPPQNLTAKSGLPRKITLSWDKNPEKDITHYNIYRSMTPNGEYKKIGKTKTSEYTDKKLKDFTEYYYFVTAVDKDKLESKPSETVSARTKPIPTTPKNIKAISNQARKITLIWDKNPEEDIKYYEIYASKKIKGKFKKIGETENNVFEYKKLKDNQTFYFKIKAIDQDKLESEFSEVVSATTKPIPPSPKNLKAEYKDGHIILSWETEDYKDTVGFVIYKNGKKIEIVNDTIYIDNKVKPGKTYKYFVCAIDNDKLESKKSNVAKIKIKKEK